MTMRFILTLLIAPVLALAPAVNHLFAKEYNMPDKPVVMMKTTQGVLKIELKPGIAPKACENFIRLAQDDYYNGIIFHRIIKDFMIQGGDPTGTGRGGESVWGGSFEDEFNEGAKFDKPGLLAMANSGPNTNGSQFFITTTATPWLNMRHTIFGEVVDGYDVIDKLEGVNTDGQDKPMENQKILKIEVIPAK